MAIARKVIKTKNALPDVPESPQPTAADVQALAARTGEPAWVTERRMSALETFNALPMPTLNDEAWRRTDIRPYAWHTVVPGAVSANGYDKREIPAELLKPLGGEQDGGLIVLTAGETTTATLQPEIAAQGVVFADMRSAWQKHPAILEQYLDTAVRPDEGKFAALAEVLADNGVLVYVPAGVEVVQPLHSVIYSLKKAQFSRILVVAEAGAKLTFVMELASPEDATEPHLYGAIVEVLVGEGADVRFIELQSLGKAAWNISHERSKVAKDANLDWIFSAIGSKLTKSFMELNLEGDNAVGRMSGFYFAEGDQHLDHDTQQNHKALHTTSDLLFKGALRDESRSVWQGMIYVAPGAQKTDGYQANRNLVLSKKARADSIPGLEIMADDVRCTHGATVGKLEEEHIFYLMARGIDRATAERVVVDGFFDPIMQRIPFDDVRERLKNIVDMKMSQGVSSSN